MKCSMQHIRRNYLTLSDQFLYHESIEISPLVEVHLWLVVNSFVLHIHHSTSDICTSECCSYGTCAAHIIALADILIESVTGLPCILSSRRWCAFVPLPFSREIALMYANVVSSYFNEGKQIFSFFNKGDSVYILYMLLFWLRNLLA